MFANSQQKPTIKYKFDNTLQSSLSPNQKRSSPKTSNRSPNQNIAINGFNNQISIGGTNVVLNVNLNQKMFGKPKTPLGSLIYKHLNIKQQVGKIRQFIQQEVETRKMQTPQASFNNFTKQQKNTSKMSTPGLAEQNEQEASQISFLNASAAQAYDLKSPMRISQNKKSQQYQQMVSMLGVSQVVSRNASQEKNQEADTSNQTLSNSSIKNLFNLQYVIGIGGFGKVWKVQHKKSNKIYAMKEMHKALIITKKSVNSVMNERKLLSSLKHPFLVNMNCSFQDRDNLYLVMDYLSGGDLRYHIGKMRRFSEEQTRFFIACIFVALEYLHNNQVIHRDIKPENLVLDNRGYVRITDLGIARIMRPENASDTSGTPGYMGIPINNQLQQAPEVMCRQNHSFGVDYFALGVIGYEFMLGKRPYLGRSRKEIRDQILAKQVLIKKQEIPDGWSLEAVDFINRLIQRKPVNRLGSNGPTDIRQHPWLKNYPWQKLVSKELIAPYVPTTKDDNFDKKQISIEDEENNELIQQNLLLLRRNSIQTLFDGYSCDTQSQTISTNVSSNKSSRKNSVTSHTYTGPQPNIQQQHKAFFNQVDTVLRYKK